MDDLDDDRFAPLTESELAAIPAFDAEGQKKVVADRFDYHDETGALLYQVERIEFRNPDGSFVLKDGKRKKGFPQRRPDPDRLGEWIYNLDGVAPVPYRLPGLIEAIVNDALIVITEGERKADLLVAWGFTATCNSGGAMKWRAEHSAFLRGANVIILPDNDQAGRKHLDGVAASLIEADAASVRVLELPGLPPKGDIIDWAAAGGTAERLHDLINNSARPWSPGNGHGPGEGAKPDEPFFREGNWFDAPERQPRRQKRFELVPFEAIVFETREEWLIKHLFPRQGVGAFYGASQGFKTFTLFDIALHVALGWEWAGRRVTQAPVVYIAAEGAAGLRKRKIGFEQTHDNLPKHVPFYLISAAPNLGTGQDDLEALKASIEAAGVMPGLVVIDTLVQSIGAGDENGAGMIQFVANATALANHFKCLVVAVHHVGLGDDKRLRGHTSLLGAIDVQILCERKDGKFFVSMTLQKLKDEASGIKLTAHLSRVVIGEDEDGDDVSTLIVDSIEDGEAAGGTAPQPKSIPRGQRLLMAMVAQAIDEAGELFRPFAEGPLVNAVSDDAVRRRYYARIAEKAEQGEDLRKLSERQRKAFDRAIKDALKALILMARDREGTRLLWLP